MKAYKQQSRAMLERWGEEILEGTGRPNLLELANRIAGRQPGSSDPAGVGGSFSPLAEKTDKILFDLRRMDAGLHATLLAVAFGMSAADLARTYRCSPTKAENDIREALAAFGSAVWLRSDAKEWRDCCDCRDRYLDGPHARV